MCKIFMADSMKMWLNAVSRSDKSPLAWLQALAAPLCMSIFQQIIVGGGGTDEGEA